VNAIGRLMQKKNVRGTLRWVPYRATDYIYDMDKGCLQETRPRLLVCRKHLLREESVTNQSSKKQKALQEQVMDIAQSAGRAYSPAPPQPQENILPAYKDYRELITDPSMAAASKSAEYEMRGLKRTRPTEE
jgi:hypothetical protein